MAKKKSKDLAIIHKVKINGYLQDDTVEATRKELTELNAEMDRMSEKSNKVAGRQYEKAAKCSEEAEKKRSTDGHGESD